MDHSIYLDDREPGITLAAFAATLAQYRSPALDERPAREFYDAADACGIDPAFALAVFIHESLCGTTGICARYGTKNWGNRRTAVQQPADTVATERGPFAKYHLGWRSGLIDFCRAFQVLAPYKGKRLVSEVMPVYAPASDDNDPTAYAAAVNAKMDEWAVEAQGGSTLHICLSSGHHNAQGGDASEIAQTGRLTPAIAAACRAQGWKVTVLTPDDGRGFSPDSLDTIAARCPASAHVFCETHTEAGPRGVFAIYPDWDGDTDADVRDALGPDLAKEIAKATGLPIRNAPAGVMSERQTGVGLSGSRLGVFRATAALAASTTRFILEAGSHTDPADLAIIEAPGFSEKVAAAFVRAVAAFYGVPVKPSEPTGAAMGSDPTSDLQRAYNGAYSASQGFLLGLAQYRAGVLPRAQMRPDVRARFEALVPGLPDNAQLLVCEKAVLWTGPAGGKVDGFHRGQYEALQALDVVVRY